jgi:hypothetical protein
VVLGGLQQRTGILGKEPPEPSVPNAKFGSFCRELVSELQVRRTAGLKLNQRLEARRLSSFMAGVDNGRCEIALFWLSDKAWTAIEPRLPKNQPGARRVDDRRVISGILHVRRVG